MNTIVISTMFSHLFGNASRYRLGANHPVTINNNNAKSPIVPLKSQLRKVPFYQGRMKNVG